MVGASCNDSRGRILTREHVPRRRSVSQICPPPRRPMSLAELFPGCDNDRLGVARESMLQNNLILKPELGKPRRNVYTLPGYDFNYGLYLRGQDGGVPEAICQWNSMKPRAPSAKEVHRDYKTMNRRAVKDGYVTARDQHLYHKMKDIRLSDEDERRFKKTAPKVPEDMTYGKPARPGTPFFELLQHKYKDQWNDQQRAVIKAEKEEKIQKKRRGKVYETHSALLRKYLPPMKSPPLWQMPHFQKAIPQLSTFRDKEEYKKALEVFRSEFPVRVGPLHQGIYTSF